MNVLKGTSVLNSKPVWIWADKIVSMTVNQQGGAVIRTVNGETVALTEKPDEVIGTLSNMLKGVVQT